MLHYNFPPYSVGETGRMGSPGRREIGHGKLAWRAMRPLVPDHEEFPYTVRLVSEVTESNGSSSMATVCGSSLAMMDAGIPLKRPVAGIAMGLIKEADDFAVLSDILNDACDIRNVFLLEVQTAIDNGGDLFLRCFGRVGVDFHMTRSFTFIMKARKSENHSKNVKYRFKPVTVFCQHQATISQN